MASRNIKGITVEIGGDTTKLDKALKDVEKTSREAKGELKEIDKALEKSPDNIDLWKQKQEVLNKSLQASKDKLSTLLGVQEQMNAKLASGEISGEQYRAYQREVENTRVSVEELQRAADSCSPALESLAGKGEKLKAAGETIAGAGEKMLGVTAAVAGLGAAAVKTTADFDESMAKVSAISGATGDNLQALRDKAKEMGESTKFSASESADAMTYMAMAGWKTEDMLNGISGIMDLAAASGEDLATTSDIVTDALTAFGLSADDSGHFADVLAAASSNANTNVSMMGETFKYVAPVMGTLGYSVDDASIAIGMMANAGVKASDAGTALRKGLLNLTAPAKKAKDEMQALGFYTQETITEFDQQKIDKQMIAVEQATNAASKAQSSYNTAVQKYGEDSDKAEQALLSLNIANEKLTMSQEKLAALQSGETQTVYGYNEALQNEDGSMKSLRETMDFLREKLGGLSEAEQAQAASAIFGTNAVSGMLAIVNGADSDYAKLTEAIDNAAGTSKEMADTMQDTLGGQLTILKSQLEGVAISFGEILMPTIRKIVDWIQKLVAKFKDLSPAQQEMIVKIGLIVAAIGPVLIIVGKVIAAIGTLMTWLPKIKTALVALNAVMAANPIGIIIIAIGALVAAFVLLWKNCEGFRNFWINLWENIKSVASAVIDGIKELFTAYVEFWKTVWTSMLEIFSEIANKIADFWKGVWNKLKKTVTAGVAMVKKLLSNIIDFMKKNWPALLLLIVTPFAGAFKLLFDNCESFRKFFINLWETLKTYITNVLNAIKQKFQQFIDDLKARFKSFKDTFFSIWNSIKDFFSGVASFFKDKIENIKSFFNGMLDFLKGTFTSIWTATWNGIKQIFVDIFNALKSFWETCWNGIKAVFDWFVNAFKSGIDTLKSFLEGFKTKHAEIWEAVKGHFGAVKDFFFDRVENIKSILSNIIDFVKNVFTGKWSDAWENIKNIFRNIWDSFKNIAKVPINGIIGYLNGLIRGINFLVDKLNEIHFEIPDWVPSIGGNSYGINIPHASEIPYLAKGGILSSGSAIVGEAGAELLTMMNGKAVVQPLTKQYTQQYGQNTFTTIVNVKELHANSRAEIEYVGQQIAFETKQNMKAVGI